MRNPVLLIGVIVAAALIAVAVYVGVKPRMPTSGEVPTAQTPVPTSTVPTEAQDILSPTIAPDTKIRDELKAGGSSYSDKDGVFSFLYPSDYRIDTQGEVRIYKKGKTQQGQTEMYDGVIMTFQPFPLNGQTLSQWVDARIQSSTADGTSEVVIPKRSISINGYPGYTYTMRGLGEFTSTVVQKDLKSSYGVAVGTLVADPQQVGYEGEVAAILSTLQLLK